HLARRSFPTRRSSDLQKTMQIDNVEPAQRHGRKLAGLVRHGGAQPFLCLSRRQRHGRLKRGMEAIAAGRLSKVEQASPLQAGNGDRKSTRLNSSHVKI